MRALVTGGAGFVGSHLVSALIAQADDVTVYDIMPRRGSGARSVVANLSHSGALGHALKGQEIVYHFAAVANPHGSKATPTSDFEQNTMATAKLLERMRAAGCRRIVFASSSSVYGDTTVFPTTEDAPLPIQTSLYGASKLAAEGLISAYARTFDMQATILRFAPMLGEGYRRGHVIDFYKKLRANPHCIDVLGDGQQRRSYVYVKDAMAAAMVAAQANESVGIYNVSGAETPTVNESLSWICSELGVNPVRMYTGTSWQGDKALTHLDTARMRALGWEPQVSIEEAVRRTVRSFICAE